MGSGGLRSLALHSLMLSCMYLLNIAAQSTRRTFLGMPALHLLLVTHSTTAPLALMSGGRTRRKLGRDTQTRDKEMQ